MEAKSYSFTGEIKQGKLILDRRSLYEKFVKLLDGKKVLVTVERRSARRSLSQNNLLHGVLARVLEWQGELPSPGNIESLKRQIKEDIGLCETNDHGLKKYVETSKMNKVEFGETMNKVFYWIALNCEGMELETVEDFKSRNGII